MFPEQDFVNSAFKCAQAAYSATLDSAYSRSELQKLLNKPHERALTLIDVPGRFTGILENNYVANQPDNPCALEPHDVLPMEPELPEQRQQGHTHVRQCMSLMIRGVNHFLRQAGRSLLTPQELAYLPYYFPSFNDYNTHLGASVHYTRGAGRYLPCVEHVVSEFGVVTAVPSKYLVDFVLSYPPEKQDDLVLNIAENMDITFIRYLLVPRLLDGTFLQTDFYQVYKDMFSTNATAEVVDPQKYDPTQPLFHYQMLRPRVLPVPMVVQRPIGRLLSQRRQGSKNKSPMRMGRVKWSPRKRA